MKSVTLILVLILAGVALSDKFTTKYDNVDVDEILRSDRLLNNYFKCMMEKGPCTPDGNELKKNLPEGLKTDCEPCSEIQQSNVKKVIRYLAKNKKDMFKKMCDKYDPEGIYKSKHAEEYAKEGIEL